MEPYVDEERGEPPVMVIGDASESASVQLQTLLDAHGLQRVEEQP